ncbi:MAG: SufE family protein [Micrococcales bacterium]|nr:SufE family protein [Micrococcales bacterium]
MTSSAEEIVADFGFLEGQDKLQLLLEFSESLPDIGQRFLDDPELLERVEECQSPVFIAVEGHAQRIDLHFSAPREAPTTRGFAAILSAALNHQSAETVLAFSEDFPSRLGLDSLISPLRVRGMRGMLARIKRKVGELTDSNA